MIWCFDAVREQATISTNIDLSSWKLHFWNYFQSSHGASSEEMYGDDPHVFYYYLHDTKRII